MQKQIMTHQTHIDHNHTCKLKILLSIIGKLPEYNTCKLKILLSIIGKLPAAEYNKINAALTFTPLQGFADTSPWGHLRGINFQNLIALDVLVMQSLQAYKLLNVTETSSSVSRAT